MDFFLIKKKGKYLTYESIYSSIELSIRDVQLIYKIQSLMGVGGVGVVMFRKEQK